MKKNIVKTTTVTASAVALVLAGAAYAYASWSVGSETIKLKIKTVAMPTFGSGPTIQVKNHKVTVQWIAQKLEQGVKVERYIVMRNDGTTSTQVCGAAVTAHTCKDLDVPDGTYTYTVRTVQGLWEGADSPPSAQAIVGTGTPAVAPLTAPGDSGPATDAVDQDAPTGAPDEKPTDTAGTPADPVDEGAPPPTDSTPADPGTAPGTGDSVPPPADPPAETGTPPTES
jgi:hypothetical protein